MDKKIKDRFKSLFPPRFSEDFGQHLLEYTLVLTLVVAAVITMGPYVIRSWNANMQGWDDSIEDSYTDPLMHAEPDIQLPYCECSDWIDSGCGGGTCEGTQMYGVRTCTPPGCDYPERCVCDPTCCIYYDFGECGPYGDPPCPAGERRMTEECGCDPGVIQSVCMPDPACIHMCLNPFGNPCSGNKYGDICTLDTVGLPYDMNFVAVNDSACTAGQKCEVQCVYPFVAESSGAMCICPPTYSETVACECNCDYTLGFVEMDACGSGACAQGPCPAGSGSCTDRKIGGW